MADWLGLQALADEYRQQQAKEAWLKAHPNVPPLDTMPQTNPVAALKNRVALENKLTPEAAKELYNSPVHYNISKLQPGDTMLGHFYPGGRNISLGNQVYHFGGDPTLYIDKYTPDVNKTLMHEFAHKWENNKLPFDKAQQWTSDWGSQVNDRVKQELATRSDAATLYAPGEAYATQAQNGPLDMPPAMRGYFYPGLFQTGLGPVAETKPGLPVGAVIKQPQYADSPLVGDARASRYEDWPIPHSNPQAIGPWNWTPDTVSTYSYPWDRVPPSLSNIDLFNFAQDVKGG